MKSYLSIGLIFISLWANSQDVELISTGSIWKYLDDGSNQNTAWRSESYDDSGWSEGPSELGYGDGDEATVVSYGGNSSDKHITTYFRHTFNITDISDFQFFSMKVKKDDGALVYVNGVEVMRSNFGNSTYNYLSEASTSISGQEEDNFYELLLPASTFQTGNNTIAVEVHQSSPTSSDLTFDLHLTGFDDHAEIYRVPYLQKANSNSVTVKCMTNALSDFKVLYGINGLDNEVDSSYNTHDHEVVIGGLTANTTYNYAVIINHDQDTLTSQNYTFSTTPEVGDAVSARIWVTGDAGTGHTEQFDVRDAYLNFAGTQGKADVWLMMGDNAYEHGRQEDYQMGLFDVYQEVLSNTVSFPTAGNHDLYSTEASAANETGPYFDIFSLPRNGECGGVASGTEAYYSFDYGNIHFICLESYELNRDSTGAMGTWLKSDLENNDQYWTIAYWHYAPYTKVGHDSDDPNDHSGRAIEMREQINPLLEQYGVDLVLAGHSHGYERSYLIDGHYGFSNTLTDEMVLQDGSGKADEQEAYLKPLSTQGHSGTVYLVCGSSGKLSSPPSVPHPVMYTTNTTYAGSVIIDIAGDTLVSQFLNENGVIQDYFHIIKSPFASVDEQEGSLTQIYPNPTIDFLQVDFRVTNAVSNKRVEVYDVTGKIIHSEEVAANQLRIEVANWSDGIYTVKMYGNNELLDSQMFIKK